MLKLASVHAPDIADVPGVAGAVAERFGFSAAASFHRYPLTENWTFRVDEPGRRSLVLRVYRPGGRPQVEVQSELAWMRALREDLGPIVPEILAADDGSQVFEVDAAPAVAHCFCVAFSVAPGAEPDEDALGAWFPRLGAITARFHGHARGWRTPTWFSRPTWNVATTLGERPHWGPWHSSVPDPDERAQLKRLVDTVVARLERFGTGHARFGLVHADLRLANLIADRDEIQVIDFDDCGFSWYLYDLACALTLLEGRPDVDDLVAAWVAGYREVEPLSAADEAEIPTFLMLRRLVLCSYLGLRPDTELAQECRDAGYSRESCDLAERYLARFGVATGPM
jgi:Ser/Thr protein kinase RdoA (MazF antagonist)